MKAMVLAAGLGTRLRPLTDNKPKALVEIDGRTLLDLTLMRLRSFGVREVIVNVHHFADMVAKYLKADEKFGMRVEISKEDVLLDTGGGLKKAAWFFLEDVTRANEPFVLHNVDILSSIDLAKMLDAHQRTKALATLAVKDRETSRYLLFDEENRLCGRRAGREGKPEMARPARDVKALAFCGIHVISPRLLAMLTEDGVFSIIDAYLRLARLGEEIRAFRADEYYWRDVGKLEQVQQAAQDLQRGAYNP
jgi:NDP-sugar pyrophosphorylase family protein